MANNFVKQNVNIVENVTGIVKGKRGRKSKKELIADLNKVIADLNKELITNDNTINNNITNKSTTDDNITNDNTINNNITNKSTTVDNITNKSTTVDNITNDNTTIKLKDDYKGVTTDVTYLNDDENNTHSINNVIVMSNQDTICDKPTAKKRGRKPKGGKIVQEVISNVYQTEEKPNVMLHLKCSMKELQNSNQTVDTIEFYNLIGRRNELTYGVINNENINSSIENKISPNVSGLEIELQTKVDDDNICKDVNKDICKKLKYLEHDLHINNVNNKRCACFWDTCEFDNSPIYIPKHFINGAYDVYGCFCSIECAVAYLMNENIDISSKFERYHLLNHIYGKIYGYNKDIKPAASPYYMLEKYYGNLSIQEYRALLRNERFFLIIDKPLTRVLPELHEENDDFILNNKIIPSNTFKSKIQKKKQNKTDILNEHFGLTNQETL